MTIYIDFATNDMKVKVIFLIDNFSKFIHNVMGLKTFCVYEIRI